MTYHDDIKAGTWHYTCDADKCKERTRDVGFDEDIPDNIRAWTPGLDEFSVLHYCPRHTHLHGRKVKPRKRTDNGRWRAGY